VLKAHTTIGSSGRGLTDVESLKDSVQVLKFCASPETCVFSPRSAMMAISSERHKGLAPQVIHGKKGEATAPGRPAEPDQEDGA